MFRLVSKWYVFLDLPDSAFNRRGYCGKRLCLINCFLTLYLTFVGEGQELEKQVGSNSCVLFLICWPIELDLRANAKFLFRGSLPLGGGVGCGERGWGGETWLCVCACVCVFSWLCSFSSLCSILESPRRTAFYMA